MKWKAIVFRIKLYSYGMTHVRCRQCAGYKGFSKRRVCAKCAYKNLIAAIEGDTGEPAEPKEPRT